MPHAASMPAPGLQALILCGPGSSFPTFTSNPDECPKALLPIANRPMVWYPIDFCLRMGIATITLICPPSAAEALTTAFNTNPFLTALPLPRPDILSPDGLDQNTGTAEILRLPKVKELVQTDFVVLPCDLVCELAGERLLQAWMVKSARLADLVGSSSLSPGRQPRHSGGLGVFYNTQASSLTAVKGEETDFIATAPLPQSPTTAPKDSVFGSLSQLVYSTPTDTLKDLVEEREALPIRHGLLRSHPRLRMFTKHRDAHIYFFPRWILDFVEENDRLESIGVDVAGWLAKASWQRGLAQKLHLDKVCPAPPARSDNSSSMDSRPSPRDGSPVGNLTSRMQNLMAPSSTSPPQTPDMTREPRDAGELQVPPIIAYIHATEDQANASLLRRVDTAQLLLVTSLQLAKYPSVEEAGEAASPFAHARKVAYPEGIKARTTITKQDSLIAENVTVEKTSIKETVIGANCQIQEGAKLLQCLLMEGVVVGKGCKLSKCILGKRCVIGDGSVLTACEVQENLFIEPRTEDKDNKLMSSEGLEATEAEMEEVLREVDEKVSAVAQETVGL